MAIFSMRCYQTDFVEVVHLGLQFFIEYFLSLIFIVVTNLMLVSVWIITDIVELLVLNIMIFVIRLTGLQTGLI